MVEKDLVNEREVSKYSAIWDRWQRDPDANDDCSYIDQLAQIAIAGNMPIYLNGLANAGPAGWRQWADEMKELLTISQEVKIIEDDKPRHLPWET